jgi:GTPase SAR1 family protein
MDNMSTNPLNFSLVGDRGIGKSSLLGSLPRDFVAQDLEHFGYLIFTVGTDRYQVKILEDSEGPFSRMHFLVSGWILAFDLSQITSIDQLEQYFTKYKKRIQQTDSTALENLHKAEKLFLVGTKSDLASENRLPKSTIEEFAKTKSVRYFETSSQTRQGVQEAFSTIIKSVSKKSTTSNTANDKQQMRIQKKNGRCVVM